MLLERAFAGKGVAGAESARPASASNLSVSSKERRLPS